MKSLSKSIKLFIIPAAFSFILVATVSSCVTPQAIASKSGAQLWGENCMRCHNTPSPATYSDAQWEVVGDHMHYKANLTGQETDKIVAFLKSAN